MPRKDLSLAEKIAVLDQIKDYSGRTSHRRLAELTGVPKSTVSRIISQEVKLREEWDNNRERAASYRRKRPGKRTDLDEALTEWFHSVSKMGIHISFPMLKEKANELALELGHEGFKASDGWVSRWKTRKDLVTKKDNEKGIGDHYVVDECPTDDLPFMLQNFSADNIYTCDETGLLYSATPNGCLCYRYEAISGCPKAMDCFTVLCCANMSGSDKRKLLVIGKSDNPQCFKGLRMDSLPVNYRSASRACMTSVIFEEWLLAWDAELQLEDRKIVLILDNCEAHACGKKSLTNIQLEFIPDDTSALLQPMDMGIIKNLKTLYRAKIVTYVLESIDDGQLCVTSTATEVSERIDILLALQFISESWCQIDCETVQSCFVLCGYKHSDTEIPPLPTFQEEAVSVLQRVTNYEEYLCIDIAIDCHSAYEECGPLTENPNEEIDCIKDGTVDSEPKQITLQEARKYISGLRRFFMQEGNEGSPLSSLEKCADFVHSQSIKRFKQGILNKAIASE